MYLVFGVIRRVISTSNQCSILFTIFKQRNKNKSSREIKIQLKNKRKNTRQQRPLLYITHRFINQNLTFYDYTYNYGTFNHFTN